MRLQELLALAFELLLLALEVTLLGVYGDGSLHWYVGSSI